MRLNGVEYNDYPDLSPGTYAGESIGVYTAKTFLWMFLGLLTTFAVAFFGYATGCILYVFQIPYFHIVLMVAELAVVLFLSAQLHKLSVPIARALFFLYAALNGVVFSAYFLIFHMASLILVFAMTGVYFGAMTLYGYRTKTDLTRLRPILVGGLIFLIVCTLLSLFLPLGMVDRVVCLFGIAIFLAFTAYNAMLAWPVAQLGRVLSELSKTSISSTRLFDILDAREEQDREHPRTPPMDGDIVFDHVSFGYGSEPGVLNDVSFTIKSGSTFGILGATGSGKSTLMYLLDRLYELPEGQGSITVGGVDIRDIKLSHLRHGIGMVLQEPFLFSKTFRESIADGSGRQDLETVRRYARMAVIDDAIEGFSQGYETPIGERGVTISGGQKQRVAIARMLMQDTPIKVFDDSLSAVDMETDAKIRQSIKENVHGTTILIAHRITTLMNADCILVLEKGRVAQLGTHQELISQEGIYRRIYDMQKS